MTRRPIAASRTACRITLLAASGILGLAASSVHASISYSWAVNGLGVGWVSYTASDAGGASSGEYYVFSGSTTIQSPNGANKIKIDFFPLWGYTATTLAQKSVGATATGNVGGSNPYTFAGLISSDGSGVTAQIAVLNASMGIFATPTVGPRTLSALSSGGYITPSQVAFSQSFGPSMFNTPYSSTSIGTNSMESTIVYGYVNAVPTPGAAALLSAGGLIALRRRRIAMAAATTLR